MELLINYRSKYYELCQSIVVKNKNKELVKTAFSLMSKLFKNIISQPKELKFRHLNTDNDNIRNKILKVTDTIDIFIELGYKTSDKNLAMLEFSSNNLSELETLIGVLENFIADLENKIDFETANMNNALNPEVVKLRSEFEKKKKIEQDAKDNVLKQIENDKLERLKEKETKGGYKSVDAKAKNLNYGAKVTNFKPPCEPKGMGGG